MIGSKKKHLHVQFHFLSSIHRSEQITESLRDRIMYLPVLYHWLAEAGKWKLLGHQWLCCPRRGGIHLCLGHQHHHFSMPYFQNQSMHSLMRTQSGGKDRKSLDSGGDCALYKLLLKRPGQARQRIQPGSPEISKCHTASSPSFLKSTAFCLPSIFPPLARNLTRHKAVLKRKEFSVLLDACSPSTHILETPAWSPIGLLIIWRNYYKNKHMWHSATTFKKSANLSAIALTRGTVHVLPTPE